MDKLEDFGDEEDEDLRMPGSSTSYKPKSINYKNQGRINGSSVGSSVMAISDYQTTTADYVDDEEASVPAIIEV